MNVFKQGSFFLLLFFLPVVAKSHAQDRIINRTSFLSAGIAQVKESANFGLVFKGPEIKYGMTWNLFNENRLITYEYELGTAILFSREIPALGFYLKPVDLAYMFRCPVAKNFYIGPVLKFEYNYNLYPDLQAGFDYWFANFSLGLNSVYDFKYQSSSFRIKANSSLMGITSRQPHYRDPYFYDIGFQYAAKHLHKDLSFGSVDRFNTTNLEIYWKPGQNSGITFGYVLRYSGYYKAPQLSMVSHSIKFLFSKKQKTE